MKKFTGILLSTACVLGTIGMLASCNSTKGIGEETRKIVAECEKMNRNDLFKAAAEEIGDGTLKFIGTSSRFKNAIDAFKAELAKYNPKCANMTITKDSTVDGQIYTKLLTEIESGVTNGYDGALVQDGYQLQMKGINTGYFVNYIPKEWAEANDTNKELNGNPFSLQYNMKTWMTHNLPSSSNKVVIDNVWDITADTYKGKIQTMDPRNENVNMDWLIMLTQDKWCDVLKEAYEDSTNDNKALKVESYAKYGEKQKYAYAFMDGYIKNAVFNGDDGAARDNLVKADGSIGWIVYSKIASLSETDAVSKKNITIAALGDENTDGTAATSHIKGFGGFMYKHYLQVMPYTKHPYTTCAFINFLSTTSTGYAAWGKDIGDYPSMPSINVDRTKFGHGTLSEDKKFTQNNGEANVFPCLNDPTSTWWESKDGGNVVIEDPAYIVTQYGKVMEFLNDAIAKK